MLYEFIQLMNKRYRIPKRQSRMEHPEKLASLGTVDTGRRQTTLNTTQNTKNIREQLRLTHCGVDESRVAIFSVLFCV